MLCELSSPVTESTGCGLKLLLGLINVAVLKSWVIGRLQLRMKSLAPWTVVLPLALLGTVELVVWPGLLASGFLQ